MFFPFSWILGIFEWIILDSNPLDCFFQGESIVCLYLHRNKNQTLGTVLSLDTYFLAVVLFMLQRSCGCLWYSSAVQLVESLQLYSNMQVSYLKGENCIVCMCLCLCAFFV